MIENLEACLKWMKDRRHWTESELEMDQLDRRIELLQDLLFCNAWGNNLLKGETDET